MIESTVLGLDAAELMRRLDEKIARTGRRGADASAEPAAPLEELLPEADANGQSPRLENLEFVARAFVALLGRRPDQKELDRCLRFLEARPRGREELLLALAAGTQAAAHAHSLHTLGRTPPQPPAWGAHFDPDAQAYSLHDFTQFHDRELIRRAYRGLLKREADESEVEHFLPHLRSATLSKTELVDEIYDLAGRENSGIVVAGLGKGFRLKRKLMRRSRLLRYAIRWGEAVLLLPRFVFRTQQEIHAAYALNEATHRALMDQLGKARHDANTVTALLAEAMADLDAEDLPHNRAEKVMQLLHHAQGTLAIQERRLADLETKETKTGANMSPSAASGHAADGLYLALEDRFRGSRQEIMERLQHYVPLLREAGAGTPEAPVLDLGCGRGEWLEVLRENNLAGQGLDLNPALLDQARQRGLEVTEAEAGAWLTAQPEGAFGCVTAFHLVEHLELAELLALLDSVRRVLRPGGLVILETPNPENLVTGACNFYMDPTHKRPLPPLLLEFLLQNKGFRETRILRLNRNQSRRIDDEVLDGLLFGPQDYAALGTR